MKNLAGKIALGALVVSALAPAARSQDLPPRPVRPVPVSTPYGGNGHSETWDGRVFVQTRNYKNQPTVGWSAFVLRPENVQRGPNGAPDFQNGAFSDEVALELDGTPNTGMSDHNALALTPAPGFETNPFPSNRDGAPDANGGHACYELLVYSQHYGAPGGDRMGFRRARIVVSQPHTKDAAIAKAEMLSTFEPLVATNGQSLRGIEPTITFDGRLLVWQGAPKNNGEIDVLMYSFNRTSGTATGWSPPRSISDMYHVDRTTDVAGIPFAERYPIAQQPLRAADGTLFAKNELFHGAYPWVTLDGTEIFFAATIAGQVNVNRARRGMISCVGRWTNYGVRPLDGPINPDREKSVRLFFSSPGATPSFWRPFTDVRDGALPYTAGRPVFSLFGSNTSNYAEACFEDAVDRDYVLVLHMNENIAKDAVIDAARTPDTSGNFNTGVLHGARFPQELDGTDETRGMVGQALAFADGDRVSVSGAGSVSEPRNGLTVEAYVKRVVDLARDPENRYRVLVNKPGSWHLILEENGQIQCTVSVNKQERRTGAVGPVLGLGEWHHVAFSYEAGSGRLVTYVDGSVASDTTFGGGAIDVTNNELIVGPGGQVPAAPFVGARDPVVWLDEIYLSRVVRTEAEIAQHAFRDLGRPALGPAIALPRGLDAADLRIPAANPVQSEAVELGRRLFFDPRLSRDRTISCATCHDPARGFSDGRPTSQGIGGKVLKRNAPTVVNRALATAQFLDGRAASLEVQALGPIENPDEMGSSLPAVVALLDQIPEYRDRFQRAFGTGASADGIGRALASFQRTILSGDSAYDRDALGPGERHGLELFRGKARCTACHGGSNLTDEAFHATAQTDGRDAGRELVTGRRHDRGLFKTPTLRDVARSAPYLHDGSAATLEEVVDRYDRGGNAGLDRDPEMRPLGLTASEKADLVAFLRTLDGNASVAQPTLPPDPPGLPPPPPPPPAPAQGDLVNGGFDTDASGWTIVGGQYEDKECVRVSSVKGLVHIHPRTVNDPSWVEQELDLLAPKTVRATVSDIRNDGGPQSDVVILIRVKDAQGVWHDLVSQVVSYDQGWVDLRGNLAPYVGQRITVRVEARAGGRQKWNSEHAAVDRVALE